MKLTIAKQGLLDIISHASFGVPGTVDATRSALSGIRLEASGSELTAYATDYDSTFRWTASADVGEPGTVLPSAAMLRRIIDNLPSGQVTMETTGEGEAGSLLLSCGSARYEMPLLAEQDYPSLPELPGPALKFDRAVFGRALERTVFSADPKHADAPRTVVRLEPDAAAGALVLVATDIFRISVTPVKWQLASADIPLAYIRANILQHWVHALKSGGGSVTLGFAGFAASDRENGEPVASLAVLRDGSKESAARCLPLPEYVNWKRASGLPAGEYLTAGVDAAGLAEVVHRLGTILPPTSPLWLTFSGGEARVATSKAEGRATGADVFPVSWNGPRFQIAFKPAKLEEGLKAMGGYTEIVMTTPTRPAFLMRAKGAGEKEITFEDKAFRHVIMPFGRSTEPAPE